MDALRNIVVGLDFTPSSRAALRQAARMAAWNHATLHAVHVIEASMIDEMLAIVGLGRDESWEAIREHGQKLAKQVAAETAEEVGLAESIRTEVEVGSPIELLSRAVKVHAADVLVLGVHAPQPSHPGVARGMHGGGHRGRPGPVATACLRHAPTNVLLAREDHAGPYTSVVACTDFSPTSFRAVEMAARVARRDKATLRIMHVAVPPRLDMAYAGNPLGIWPGQPLEIMEMWNTYRTSLPPRLEKFVEPLRGDMAAIGVTLDITEHEHYGRGIAEYAREHRADLLVLGNQGRTGLRAALLGSTAERALAELPCSALVVRHVEAATTHAEASDHAASTPVDAEGAPGIWRM